MMIPAPNDHIEEFAELYALGALDEPAMRGVEQHAARCEDCARRLGEAEAIVAAGVAPREPSAALDRRIKGAFVRRPQWRSLLPVAAAAFVLGLLPSLTFLQRERDESAAVALHDRATRAMIGSHFLHAQFVPLQPDAPKAKLIYARTHAWLYVVAETSKTIRVAALARGGRILALGDLAGTDGEREFFMTDPPQAAAIVLIDGSRALARAPIVAGP